MNKKKEMFKRMIAVLLVFVLSFGMVLPDMAAAGISGSAASEKRAAGQHALFEITATVNENVYSTVTAEVLPVEELLDGLGISFSAIIDVESGRQSVIDADIQDEEICLQAKSPGKARVTITINRSTKIPVDVEVKKAVYVNPLRGDDSNDGQSASVDGSGVGPLKTISKGAQLLGDAGVVYVLGGAQTISGRVSFDWVGRDIVLKRFRDYDGAFFYVSEGSSLSLANMEIVTDSGLENNIVQLQKNASLAIGENVSVSSGAVFQMGEGAAPLELDALPESGITYTISVQTPGDGKVLVHTNGMYRSLGSFALSKKHSANYSLALDENDNIIMVGRSGGSGGGSTATPGSSAAPAASPTPDGSGGTSVPDAVYLNGQSGKDTYSGASIRKAVLTYSRAVELCRQYGAGEIIICGTVTVSQSTTWNERDITLSNDRSFQGTMVTVSQGTLTLDMPVEAGDGASGICCSGGRVALGASGTVSVRGKGTGIILQTGSMTFGQGSITVSDGGTGIEVQKGTLTMDGGSVDVRSGSSEGIGVKVAAKGSFLLNHAELLGGNQEIAVESSGSFKLGSDPGDCLKGDISLKGVPMELTSAPKYTYCLRLSDFVLEDVVVSGNQVALADVSKFTVSASGEGGIAWDRFTKNMIYMTGEEIFLDTVYGADSNDGKTPRTAFKTLEKALEVTGSSSEINIIYLLNTVQITQDVTVGYTGDNGLNVDLKILPYANLAQSMFRVAGGTLTLGRVVVNGRLTMGSRNYETTPVYIDGDGAAVVTKQLARVEGGSSEKYGIVAANGILDMQDGTVNTVSVRNDGTHNTNGQIKLYEASKLTGEIAVQADEFKKPPVLIGGDMTGHAVIPLHFDDAEAWTDREIAAADGVPSAVEAETCFQVMIGLSLKAGESQRDEEATSLYLRAQDAVYWASAGDDRNDGKRRTRAVKTFDRAWELASRTRDGFIVICGSVNVTDDESWVGGPVTLDGYTWTPVIYQDVPEPNQEIEWSLINGASYMINVAEGCRLTVRDIILDGKKERQNIDTVSYGIWASDNAVLHLTGDTAVQNFRTADAVVRVQSGVHCTIDGNVQICGNVDGSPVSGINATLELGGDACIYNNQPTSSGGGIDATSGRVTVKDNARIINNMTWGYGGGIDAMSGTVTIKDNACISNNSAMGAAGGIRAGKVTLQGNARIIDNISHEDGGGVLTDHSRGITMEGNAQISNNRAYGSGGGIWFWESGGGIALKDNARISDNTAYSDGGGIWFQGTEGGITLEDNARISDNTAYSDGGGISFQGTGKISLADYAQISDNRALNGDGGGVCIEWEQQEEPCSGELEMTGDSRISGNSARDFGGGVNSSRTTGTNISESDNASRVRLTGRACISDNSSGYVGGVCTSGKLTLADYAQISDNQSLNNAGGVRANEVMMTDSAVVSGNSGKFGGGIYCDAATIKGDARISGNSAQEYGGGIYCNGKVMLAGNARVSDNYARKYGGGIYSHGSASNNKKSKITMADQSQVLDNVTDGKGGGFYILDCDLTLQDAAGIYENSSGSDVGDGIFASFSTAVCLCDGTVDDEIYIDQSAVLKLQGSRCNVTSPIILYGRWERNAVQVTGTMTDTGNTYKIRRAYTDSVTDAGNVIVVLGDTIADAGNVIVVPGGTITDASQYIQYFTYDSDQASLDKGGVNIVLARTVYIDGERGDDANDGSSPSRAKKTLPTVLNSDTTYYICGKVTIDRAVTITGKDTSRIVRYTGFSVQGEPHTPYRGDLFRVEEGVSLTLARVNLAGMRSSRENFRSTGFLVDNQGELKLSNGTTLTDNTKACVNLAKDRYIEIVGSNTPGEQKKRVTVMMENPANGDIVVKGTSGNTNIDLFGLDSSLTAQYCLEESGDNLVLGDARAVYLHPDGGSDTNDGASPETPVRTLQRAHGILGKSGGNVYIMSPVDVSSTENDPDGDITDNAVRLTQDNIIYRGYTRGITMFNVKPAADGTEKELLINDITIDGDEKAACLVDVAEGGTFTARGDSRLLTGDVWQEGDSARPEDRRYVMKIAGKMNLGGMPSIEGLIYLKGEDTYIAAEDDLWLTQEHPLQMLAQILPEQGQKRLLLKHTTLLADVVRHVSGTYKVIWERGEDEETGIYLYNPAAPTVIYVDGQNGNDGNSGGTPEQPVLTLKRAYELLRESFALDLGKKEGEIVIVGKVEVTEATHLSGSYIRTGDGVTELPEGRSARLLRYGKRQDSTVQSFTGTLLEVSSRLNLEDIEIDGHSMRLEDRKSPEDAVADAESLITVKQGGRLTTGGKVTWKNNDVSRGQGGAVCNYGALDLSGVTVSGCSAREGAAIYQDGSCYISEDNEFGHQEIYLPTGRSINISGIQSSSICLDPQDRADRVRLARATDEERTGSSILEILQLAEREDLAPYRLIAEGDWVYMVKQKELGKTVITLKDKTVTRDGSCISVDEADVTGSSGQVDYTYYLDKEAATKTGTDEQGGGAAYEGGAPSGAGTYYVIATVEADDHYEGAVSNTATLLLNDANSLEVIMYLDGHAYTGQSLALFREENGIPVRKYGMEEAGKSGVYYASQINVGTYHLYQGESDNDMAAAGEDITVLSESEDIQKQINFYTVTYDANTEDAITGSLPTGQVYREGSEAVPDRDNAGNLSRAGYTLKGWAASPDGAVVESMTVSRQNCVFYAVWEKGEGSAPPSTQTSKPTQENPSVQQPPSDTALPGLSDQELQKLIEEAKKNNWVGADVALVDYEIIHHKTDDDIDGSLYAILNARVTKSTENSEKLVWNRLPQADGYIIYGNKCGLKNRFHKIKTVGKSRNSYLHKNLEKGTYYKFIVVAYRNADGYKETISVSKNVHAVTEGGKYGVAKTVKINKSTVTLEVGETFKIRAEEVREDKDKIIRPHRGINFESDRKKTATARKGIIRAKRTGRCNIYVYAQNGAYKKIKVTVKPKAS